METLLSITDYCGSISEHKRFAEGIRFSIEGIALEEQYIYFYEAISKMLSSLRLLFFSPQSIVFLISSKTLFMTRLSRSVFNLYILVSRRLVADFFVFLAIFLPFFMTFF